MIRLFLAALAALVFLSAPALARERGADVEELLAADRAFAAAAARAPAIADAFAAMFDADVVVPLPGRGLLVGRDAVLEVYRASPSFREGAVSWAPVRGGISADGTQGFTFGYLDVTAGPDDRRNRKYLAYWVRRAEGWRVVAYRQVPRPPGAVSTAMIAPSLPARSVRPNPRAIPRHQASLAAAEQAFSDRAQQIGLRAAFREFGRQDAMNMSEGAAIAIGLDAITAHFPEGQTTSPLNWRTERSYAASSGDLGVSIGIIRANGPVPEGRPASIPFFTVWRRDRTDAPWRYVAE
ncbi:MAG TPA: DUF4440 domain-containing protein [Allosphingosinicella sp.]|nr:DUF4440 domain-containing protein [Allosphingosinicella sp.]